MIEPDPPCDLIFVYGTLLRDVPRSRHDLLESAEFVARGHCKAQLLCLGDYPGAVPSTNSQDRVVGEVYRLQGGLSAITRLDRYEGFVPGSQDGCEFRRELVEVVADSGEKLRAWIYYYNL